MSDTTLKILNPTETIINALPAITEAFVTFYGESERERIINKFNNLLVIGYARPNQILGTINKSNKTKSEELINEFLDKLSTNQDETEKLKKLFFSDYELQNSTLQPLRQYIAYIDKSNQSNYNKNNVVTFLKQIYPETTIDNLDELIQSGRFSSIDTIVPLYKQILEKYKIYTEKTKPYTDYVNDCNQLQFLLAKKYTKLLVEELKDLFTESEYQAIQDRFNSKFNSTISDINGKTHNFIGYSINSSTNITAFSEENNKLLENGKEWQINSIKRDRVKYFKSFGIDLGEDYQLYLNNPQAQALVPTQELIDRIVNAKKKLYEQKMNEYYKSIKEYQQNRARIEAANLLDKEDGYDARAYAREGTAITTNLKIINGQMVEYPILLMYMGAMEEYYDSALIHELNHVYELSLQSVDDTSYQMTCGWDIVDGTINNQREENFSLDAEREKRDYELINEIINELIAQEISQILSESGIYIFNTPENKKIKGGTSYEYTMFLIKDFYENYKEAIIESRKTGNMQVLFDIIGKENFEALNELFHEHNKHFSGFAIYQMYKDLKEGIETEKTQKFKELVTRQKSILAQMESHSRHKKH